MRAAHALTLSAALIGLSTLACMMQPPQEGSPPTPDELAAWDVRGNYTLTHEDALTVRLTIGGVTREATASGMDQLVDLGTWEGEPLVLNLAEHCARPEVTCPSEALWPRVSINQRDVQRRQTLYGLDVINNTTRELPEGQRAKALGGLMDRAQRDQFLIGIDGQSGGQGDCGALALSVASGRFSRQGERDEEVPIWRTPDGAQCEPMGDDDPSCVMSTRLQLVQPPGAPVDGIADGRVTVGWLGACAFGPALVAATLSVEARFSATRTGDFDPPPFTPAPTLPDAPQPDASPDLADMSGEARVDEDMADADMGAALEDLGG